MFLTSLSRNTKAPKPKEAQPEEEVDMEDETMTLPDNAHVRIIFEDLKQLNTENFSVNTAPIVQPYPPGSVPMPVSFRASTDPFDSKLIENIRALFNSTDPSKFNIEEIQRYLIEVATRPNPTMVNNTRQTPSNRESKKAKNAMLKEFYPHLARLIIAVSTHVKNMESLFTIHGRLATHDEEYKQRRWGDVLNKLHELRNIILYLNKKESFLGNNSQLWENAIAERNTQIQQLTNKIHALESKINGYQQQINEKNIKMSEIEAQYQPVDDLLTNASAEKRALQENLNHYQNVMTIATENINLLNPDTSTSSRFSVYYDS